MMILLFHVANMKRWSNYIPRGLDGSGKNKQTNKLIDENKIVSQQFLALTFPTQDFQNKHTNNQ